MRTTRDAIRSIARYASEAFGEDWSVNLWAEQGTMIRPAIAVRKTGPTLITGPRHIADLVQPVALYVYPPKGDSPEASFAAAADADDTLFNAFRIGIGAGHAMRVPLFDYEGAGLDEASELRRDPDYLRVLDFSVEQFQSPEDESMWSIVASLRVGWRRTAEHPDADATRLVEDLRVEITGR